MERRKKEKISIPWGRYCMVSIVLIIAVFLLFAEVTELQALIIKAILSLTLIVLPVFIIEPFLASNRFIASLPLLSCLIICAGAISLKIWSVESDLDVFVILPLLPLAIIFLKDFLRLIKDPGILETNSARIDNIKDLVKRCLEVRLFRALLISESGILLLGAFSHMLVVIYAHEEMSGLPVLLLYLICFIVFSIANLFGMLSITKKVKKSPLSVVSFAIITPIAIPLCIIYFLILLSISEKLAGW